MVALVKAMKELAFRRDLAANESVIYETEQGKAMARARAYAYNEAMKILATVDGAPGLPPIPAGVQWKPEGIPLDMAEVVSPPLADVFERLAKLESYVDGLEASAKKLVDANRERIRRQGE